MILIEQLTAARARDHIESLIDILCDVVDGGASVSFLRPLDRSTANAFWTHVVRRVETDEIVLFVARRAEQIVGTVQLVLAQQPNQPHRADVAKLLVHRIARRFGVANALMSALESAAASAGRTLLTLDTVQGSPAEQLYANRGFVRAGVIPRYARSSDGELEATVVFYKELA
jgi:GNAT superfamily N-acetyltransferase